MCYTTATTPDPEAFRHTGGRFLGTTLPPVEHVAEEAGRLLHKPRAAVAGQVVR